MMEKYHIAPENEEPFMMGMTLKQWSEDTKYPLSEDQKTLVKNAEKMIQDSVSVRIQEHLTNETKALYVSWMNQVTGVDGIIVNDPQYHDGGLDTSASIP